MIYKLQDTTRSRWNMNTSQKIGLAAVSVFAVSYFMPAFDTFRGFACFLQCWETLWHFDPSDLGCWFYYSGFALSNIMLPILAVWLFVGERGWRFRSIVSFVMLLHTASWSVFEFSSSSSSIKFGYYLWLEAYVLLFFAYRFNQPNNSSGCTLQTAECGGC